MCECTQRWPICAFFSFLNLSYYLVRQLMENKKPFESPFANVFILTKNFLRQRCVSGWKGAYFSPFFLLWSTLVESEDELMSSALSLRMTTHRAPYGCGLTTTCIHWWLPLLETSLRFAWRLVPRPWNLNKHPENVLFVKQQRANKWGTRALVCHYSTVHFPLGRIYDSLLHFPI